MSLLLTWYERSCRIRWHHYYSSQSKQLQIKEFSLKEKRAKYRWMTNALPMYIISTFSSNLRASQFQVNARNKRPWRIHSGPTPLDNILTKDELKKTISTWLFMTSILVTTKHFDQVSQYMYLYLSSGEFPKISLSLIGHVIATTYIWKIKWFIIDWPLCFFHSRLLQWFSLCQKKCCIYTLSKRESNIPGKW